MAATRLAGSVVLITGASSGLGRAFALQCAAEGARVVAAARRVERLKALVDEIEARGGEALAAVLDVTCESSVRAAFDAAEARFGLVDALVANAGVNKPGAATELSMTDFDETFAINVRGAFLTAREGAKRLMASKREGRMVLIASIGGETVLPGLTAYCASKAALIMMGRSLAREWARANINVNVVCPGYIETEINADWFASDVGLKQVRSFPRRRLMQAQTLHPIVTFLLSRAAQEVTGSVFRLDDGQTL